MKNPYAGTMAAELYKHLTRTRGWTDEQVRDHLVRLWDRWGGKGRFRLLTRCHNALVLRRLRARHKKAPIPPSSATIIE